MFAAGLVRVYNANVLRYRHSHTPLSSFPVPDAHFDVIHIDLVGPLPTARGFTYLLTSVDRFTRWPEAFPLSHITAEAVAQAFLSGWISRFGVPSTIVTDRGRQFESDLWHTLMSLLGSKRAHTMAYHPQTNGMVERFHRQLKAALKAQPNPHSWMDALPLVLLGIRTSLKEDTSATAAEMVYGTTLRLPGEFFNPSPVTSVPDPSNYVSRLRASVQHIHPVSPHLTQSHGKVVEGLSTATHVFSDMTLYVNHSSLLMMDLTKCSNAQTNISHSPLKVVMILFQLIASSLHTSITILHISHHRLQLQPLHLLEQPVPVDMFTSQSTSHHSCRNTLGESDVVN